MFFSDAVLVGGWTYIILYYFTGRCFQWISQSETCDRRQIGNRGDINKG